MGRELKRVPLGFDWPVNTVWKGYQNPYSPTECKKCNGSGLNKETKKLSDDWYSHLREDGREGWGYHLEQEDVQALVDEGRLWDFTRRPINEEQVEIVKKKIADGGNSWLPFDNGYIPTAEEVNEWAKDGMGHDSINRWICTKARAERLGIYGLCPLCDGHGHYWPDDKYEELWNSFERIEPPEGEGYQIWETVSEGSPISPVFKTSEELARHMAGTKWGADKGSSFETWMKFIEGPGWCMTGFVDSTGLHNGVEIVNS